MDTIDRVQDIVSGIVFLFFVLSVAYVAGQETANFGEFVWVMFLTTLFILSAIRVGAIIKRKWD